MNALQLDQARDQLQSLRANLAGLQRSPKVLAVEDDLNDVSDLKKKLHPFRVSFDCCRTSLEAIEKLKAENYDLVFLDLRLDGGSGLDVLTYAETEQIKSFFIVLTGMDDSDPMIQEALKRGAVHATRKPITEAYLRLTFGALA